MILDQQNFGLIKLSGLAICFVLMAIVQEVFPYRKMTAQVLRNWSRNLPLSAANAGLVAVGCAGCVCAWSTYLEKNGIGLLNLLGAPLWVNMATALFVLDGTAYFWHRMNHKISFLWRFHAVHHSDHVFEASTALRFHFGELLMSLGIRLLVVAIFGLAIPAILFFELVFQFFNIFEHANLRLASWVESALSSLFITPALHRKHHSVGIDELNSNFGTIFSFWDHLGRSYRRSSSDETIKVGLLNVPNDPGVLSLIAMPVKILKDEA